MLTADDISFALGIATVAFLTVLVSARAKPWGRRLRSSLFLAVLFGGGQLVRVAFDLHFEPPVSTILDIGIGAVALAGLLLLMQPMLREILGRE